MAKDGFKVLDSDMHVIEPPDLWPRYIEPAYRDRAPVGTRAGVRDIGVTFADGQSGAIPDMQYDVWVKGIAAHQGPVNHHFQFAEDQDWDGNSQLQAMDMEGIDVAVLFPSRGLFVMGVDSSETAQGHAFDPDFATAIGRAYNNWMYDMCAADTSRLYGAAMVAPHDVPGAVKETRRCVTDLGFKAIFLLPGMVNKKPWHHPDYDPLWAECQDLDIPVVFHGGGPDILEPDFGLGFRDSLMLWHTFSHSLGPMSALVSMIGGGVFDRFPKLRSGYLEANCSWAPWLIYRLEDHYEDYIGRHEIALKRRVSEYFAENCVVSVESDEAPSEHYVRQFGDDNVVFSTDYPHPDTKFPKSVEKFLTLPLPDETKRKFLWDNCAKFYKL
jgi:predicted TIM-barrel fold metal-dependent hydrolase